MGSQHLRQQFLLEKSSSNDNKNNCDEDKKKNKHSRSSQKKILKLYLEQVENINSSLCKKDNNEFLCSKQVHVNKLYECIILKLKLIKDNKHATIEQKQLDDIETNIKQLRNDIQTFKKLSNETNLKLLSISLCQYQKQHSLNRMVKIIFLSLNIPAVHIFLQCVFHFSDIYIHIRLIC
ncbi:unnamed protein product [Didymodactylos carnosus]|uniref:Uncharacterized protein n=1 Tax=Didymodactylos carnosus TaxID=1234261 RepID=A0A8S2QH47_9BILA|nr:unnamed protein product [Didymodactylos carnosus]CAF4101966.1 unnamed protein product [Didymodactylos carnosus]